MPEWRWWWLECSKNESQNARAWLRLVKRFGNVGEYFNVLNWASLKGLSLLTWGRLWDCSKPRSARSWLTVLDVIDAPRSACRESCPAGPCSSELASAMTSSARRAASRLATRLATHARNR